MPDTDRRTEDTYIGCLLGGAAGDALGAPVEFLSLRDIRAAYGSGGIGEFAQSYNRPGAITDDTQMTLFTAEGLLRADNRLSEKGICDPPTMVYLAYLRWLETQGHRPKYPYSGVRDSYLLGIAALRSSRAPGNTCLSALISGRMGTREKPLNESKGCGGVMRVAPVGLAAREPFDLGCDLAAITHGHPTGYLAAGCFASIIGHLAAGAELGQAVDLAITELDRQPRGSECLAAVTKARDLAAGAPATAETVERLGQGWTAEEALAIAVFCALRATSFEHGVRLAVNHGGDSDSTGSMTGNILGALLGRQSIPERWLTALELREEIEGVARDLWRHFGQDGEKSITDDDWSKYPGW